MAFATNLVLPSRATPHFHTTGLSRKRHQPGTRIRERKTATASIHVHSHSEEKESAYAPVLILPGLGNASADYNELSQKLIARGHKAVATVPMRRWQWGQNAKGFLKKNYWNATLTPELVLDWYFKRIDRAVSELMEQNDGGAINVIGHSAGGWLGRAYIAERAPEGLQVSTLLTLGTPNRGPPAGTVDQTRGLLRYVEERCDVSQLVSDLICVAGTGTVGKRFGKGGSVSELIAYYSYAAVCGKGDVDGDGVTPVDAACAENGTLVLCDDCDHSMLTSKRWYGSDTALAKWGTYLQ